MERGFTPEEVFASLCSFSPLDKRVPLSPLVLSARGKSKGRTKRRRHELFLDALATLCACSDGRKMTNVALALEPYSNNQLKLYIAANGEVSPDLVAHIQTIWSYLSRLTEEQNPIEAYQSVESKYSAVIRELLLTVYSFMWIKFRKQIRKHSKFALDALQKLPPSLYSVSSDNEFRYQLMDVLSMLLKLPDNAPPNSSNLDAMHRTLRRLSRRMMGKEPGHPAVSSSTIEAWEASMNESRSETPDIPFMHHVKKITHVSDSIAHIQYTLSSPRIRKMSGLLLDIIHIPREFRPFSINIASSSLFVRYMNNTTYRIHVDRNQINFEEYARMLWDLDVVQPINERLGHLKAGSGGFYHDHVPVHPECTLVRYMLIHDISSIPYVGCSRDVCLGCWAFTCVMNRVWHTEIGLRGCSRKVIIPHVFSHYPLHGQGEERELRNMLWHCWDTAWELRRDPARWERRREDSDYD